MKEAYGKFAKKYNLPGFDELDNEFELSPIEDNEKFLLREVRRKICEKIDCFIEVVEPIIQPDTHIKDLHEARLFSKKDIDELYIIYRRLLFYYRDGNYVSTICKEDEDARFIKEFYTEYPSIKDKILSACEKLKDAWQKESESEDSIGYLG